MIKQRKLWMIKTPGAASSCSFDSGYENSTAVVNAIMQSRGFTQYGDSFLKPSWKTVHDPFLLKDMELAVERIFKAIQSEEKICIYGDYDADGITATALLVSTIRRLGGCVEYYIPDRLKEGYGLNNHALERIIHDGSTLVVSVDCGISGLNQAGLCKQLGVDLIITDHHEPQETLPKAFAILNPKRKDNTYPFQGLAGVGVAFKLAQALLQKQNLDPDELLDLVAVGTVADIVPLLDENRFFVMQGLSRISEEKRPGLKALMDVSGINSGNVGADVVGFSLGPRINASGRVGSPMDAVELLLTKDKENAILIASRLDQWNRQRQLIEADILEEVRLEIEKNAYEDDYVIVVTGNGWHPGVVGIVSSRITDLYGRPSLILTQSPDDQILKGSARSIDGFNLFNALSECSEYLEGFGGHEQAAGLSIQPSAVFEFRQKMNRLAREELSEEDLVPSLSIDMEIPHSILHIETAKVLKMLTPYGEGNRNPLFLCRDMFVDDYRKVGSNGDHLKLKLKTKTNRVDAIAFSLGELAGSISSSECVDVVFTLDINLWNGRESVQLLVRDMKSATFDDNLTVNHSEMIYIDALSQDDAINQYVISQEPKSPEIRKAGISEKWVKQNHYSLGEAFASIEQGIIEGKKCCLLVSTREQCRHFKTILFERFGDSLNPVVLHQRMDSSAKEINWEQFLRGEGHPLIFTGLKPFIEYQPLGLENLYCLYPFYSVYHYEQIKEWAERSDQPVTIYHLFQEKHLLRSMLVLESLFPDRGSLGKIYLALREMMRETGETELDLVQWSEQMKTSGNVRLLPEMVINSLIVFQELGLIHYSNRGTSLQLQWVGEPTNKLDLDDSNFYRSAQDIKAKYQKTFSQFRV